MWCKNPESCQSMHRQWIKLQEKNIPLGKGILEGIIQMLEEGIDIPFSERADKRSLFRAFSIREIGEAILNGWVIEYDINRKTLLVL